jgi:hypothetical protein
MHTLLRPLSLYDALSGKRLRLDGLPAGTQLTLPILGYWRRPGALTVYVAGTTPPALRTAAEEGRTGEEVLFADLAAGLQEIELQDCRYEFRVLLPSYGLHVGASLGRVVPLYGAAAPDDALAA